jgi:uncharacterized protein YhaN
MRLQQLDLTRYGHFTDRRLVLPPPAHGVPDLHVIFGENEAGKSTLFSAWLDLLFGIPPKSPHDFLHPYAAMRIGATLGIDGTDIEVTRVKKPTASLLDSHGGLLPEAVLQGAMGGLTRASYEAMFSLDDDTLVRGGDSILASKGDLGEMLFSASAGLSDLSRKLEGLRAAADKFHKAGGRSGPVTEAKAHLADLEARRKELDVQAGAFKALVAAEAEARAAWTKVRDDHQRLIDEQKGIARRLALLPAQTRYQLLQTELAPLAGLPILPDGLADRIEALQRRLATIDGRRDEVLLSAGKAERDLAALALDPAMLTMAERVAMAEAHRAGHDEAVKDLPNRHSEAEEQQRLIDSVLTALGQSGAVPRDLLLNATTIVNLRALIAQRSGIVAGLTSAAREAEDAGQAADRLERKLLAAGTPGDSAALAALLGRFRQIAPTDTVTRSRRAQEAAADELARRLKTLLPWQGDAETLAALQVPGGWQIDGWNGRGETLRAALSDASRLAEELRQKVSRASTSAAAKGEGIGLAEASQARASREKLWADHRLALSQPSAETFEQAMRQDDLITARLADLRLDEAERVAQALSEQELVQAETSRTAATLAVEAHEAEIATALSRLGLPGKVLGDLRGWLEARTSALAALSLLREAERDSATALRSLSEAEASLRTLLVTPQRDFVDVGYDLLWAEAQARVEADRTMTSLREQARDARIEADKRIGALTDARRADEVWHTVWRAAIGPTWLQAFGGTTDSVMAALTQLDSLATAVALHDTLVDRIAKMTANRDVFAGERARIAQGLGLPEGIVWVAVLKRLSDAESAGEAHVRLSGELQDARQRLADITAESDASTAGLTRIAAELGTDMLSLPAVVGQCQRAAELRRQIAACESELATLGGEAGAEALADRSVLEADADRLTGEIALLDLAGRDRFARLTEAQRQLREVGGDDAVARIEVDRQFTLDQLAEGARQQLALRLGILVLGHGLRRYRDSHRSAMLQSASEAFATITRGNYRSLAAQPTDTGGEVLVAMARNGAAKLATELSRATRSQLYLALRIAGYHELAKSRRPVPFLADDIMETFDNRRAAEAFRLLAGMAGSGQVIYLTHHAHLCDIARAECPGVMIHDLQPQP